MHKAAVEWVFEYIVNLKDKSQEKEMYKYISEETRIMSLNHFCNHRIIIPKNAKLEFVRFSNVWNSHLLKNQKIVTFRILGLVYNFEVDSEDFKMCTEKDDTSEQR